MTAPTAPAGLSVADVLDRAADLIEPEGRWTQGACARNAEGERIDWERPDAACFCALGAVFAVSNGTPLGADDLFGRHLGGSGWAAVPRFNDTEGRTQAEVVATLRSAAEAARAQVQA